MKEIPADVMDEARNVAIELGPLLELSSDDDNRFVETAIARAILAERERCAKLCEDADFDDYGLCAKLIRGEITG